MAKMFATITLDGLDFAYVSATIVFLPFAAYDTSLGPPEAYCARLA